MIRSLAFGCMVGVVGVCAAQTPSSPVNASNASPASGTKSGADEPQRIWIRDPRTGRIQPYDVRSTDATVTQWRQRVVEQTVYTPQTVMELRQIPQTVYVAETQYVSQPAVTGAWNPFAQPTYAVKQVPVTRWVPKTTYVTKQVPVQKLVPRQELLAITEPVVGSERTQQVALAQVLGSATPVTPRATHAPTTPANSSGSGPSQMIANSGSPAPVQTQVPNAYAVAASSVPYSQPWIANIPVLARQQVLPVPPPSMYASSPSVQMRPTAPSVPFSSWAPSQSSAYYPPMNVATTSSAPWAREPGQAAMQPTVVR